MNALRRSGIEQSSRRGAALIMAIVCLTLLSGITISLVRLTMLSSQQVEREQWRMQSAWLADSALLTTTAVPSSEIEEGTQVWTPADIGPRQQQGRVTITIAHTGDDPSKFTVTATADYPDHPTDRVRTTRTRTLIVTEETTDTPSDEVTP